MGTPTALLDCTLSSDALERIELMVGKGAKTSERSPSTASGYRALAVSRRLAGGVRRVPP
jgi:hypothetical protein